MVGVHPASRRGRRHRGRSRASRDIWKRGRRRSHGGGRVTARADLVSRERRSRGRVFRGGGHGRLDRPRGSDHPTRRRNGRCGRTTDHRTRGTAEDARRRRHRSRVRRRIWNSACCGAVRRGSRHDLDVDEAAVAGIGRRGARGHRRRFRPALWRARLRAPSTRRANRVCIARRPRRCPRSGFHAPPARCRTRVRAPRPADRACGDRRRDRRCDRDRSSGGRR